MIRRFVKPRSAKLVATGMITSWPFCTMKAVVGMRVIEHANRQRLSGARQVLQNVRELEP